MAPRVKGCRNCSRRRISCDRTTPHCRKCARDGLECYGLQGVYRWIDMTKKMENYTKPLGTELQAPLLKVEGDDASPFECRTLILPSIENLPPAQPDWWIVNYFAEELTPWMCPILKADNECKKYIVPIAASSQLVFDAVAATGYHRIAYYGNADFEAKAERYKASAINRLLASCHSVFSIAASVEDRLFAAAALLILMYDEMIAAHDYFTMFARIIARMREFIDFSTLGGSAELQKYIQGQFSILTLFALLQLDATDSKHILPSILGFLDDFESAGKIDRDKPPFLAYCWRKLLGIWELQQNQVSALDVEAELTNLRDHLEANEMVPQFDHYLTWVYFIAAAASPSESLRLYFTQRLSRHTATLGWKNVGLMVGLLGQFEIASTAWPSHLQRHKEYLCA